MLAICLYKCVVIPVFSYFSDMLAMGSSAKWPDAMEAITGQREMDAGALVEFFKPLTDWLEIQNAGHDITWDDQCPPESLPTPRPSSGVTKTMSLWLFLTCVWPFLY